MEGIWPLVVLWILFSVIGSRKKKPNAPGSGQSAMGNGPVSLQDKFKAAMEELKRAEREAMGQAPQPELKPPPARPARPARQAFTVRKHEPRTVPRKSVVHEAEVVPDESSETVFTPEGKADFDDDVEAVIARRREAVVRRGDLTSRSVKELTAEQMARRGGRPDVAIGGQAEHDAWHLQIQAAAPQGPRRAEKRRSVFQRYADGSARGALILTEILGKPKAS